MAENMDLSPLRYERGQVHVFGLQLPAKWTINRPKNGPVPSASVNGYTPAAKKGAIAVQLVVE